MVKTRNNWDGNEKKYEPYRTLRSLRNRGNNKQDYDVNVCATIIYNVLKM